MKPHLVVVGTLSMFCIAVPGESSLLLTSLTKSIKIPSSIKRYNVVETVPRAQPCPAGAEKKREAERELHYPPISCTLRDQDEQGIIPRRHDRVREAAEEAHPGSRIIGIHAGSW